MSTHGSPPIQRPAAVVVASSSVAQVRTRIACSLSSAARTVLWCVSGTLRIHPRCGWRGGAATSAASQARASRNVSLSVSMMSDAGIDSGIGASREMIAYRTRNRRMKGLLMLRAVATPIALVLVLDGASPAATDRVKVHYHGTLTDGTVFDSSVKRGEPLTIALGGGVIKCWSEGVPLMKVGGKSRLVCPSDLAYGDQGRPPTIKPGATLVFEVDLLEIVK